MNIVTPAQRPQHAVMRAVEINTPMSQLKSGDMLTGYRFAWDGGAYKPDENDGRTTSTVWPRMPISGPVFLRADAQEPSGPTWHLWWSVCGGCGERSRMYTRRHSALRTWAIKHRCKTRVELVVGQIT